MKSIKNIGFIAIILISLSSCSNRFSNTVYKDQVIDNKTLAVLPYKVITTGRIPREITDEMLLEIEAGEAEAFQASLYHQFLDRLSRRNYQHLNIKVQSYHETNRRLEEAGFDIIQSTELTSKELAQILGVDAVVRSNVHKNKYLTDLESYGIEVATNILFIFTDINYWFLPNNRTGDVRISTSIIDVNDGNALWSASRRCPTDWRINTYDAIEQINYRISKRLPR